jgi:hypothetical protein
MPALQKHAIFTLVVAAAALLVFTATLPFAGFVRSSAAFAILSLWALSGIFYRKRSRDGVVEPVYDERDRAIQQRANTIMFVVLGLIFVGASMDVWWRYGDSGRIPASFLPIAVGVGGAIMLVTWSIAILWQYHRQG